MRSQQREATRKQIVSAALIAISEAGFDGVSTRTIAERANVSQGLLTYHFKTKEGLWRAAADYIFELANHALSGVLEPTEGLNRSQQQRDLIRQLVYFSADHPEFTLFMMENGKEENARSRWLVETHVLPIFKVFARIMDDVPEEDIPHLFYVIAGASGVIFCAPYECKRLSGIDPNSKAAIQRHADYLANLIVPV